ncbi:hypothetical protein psal_cds_352 [Pandoravirus salinus]|uniref:Uncharacterized protein n=1 Tax=Pandoravirus salinus TaxID=1349410 RepID=S4VU34_9VIRU|nr:hypothetical protein psal_cds_352 [Pandoravirus salinus]AGO83999.1 hypothetical protein psal_cds_352 [Pandoravirus salinus]
MTTTMTTTTPTTAGDPFFLRQRRPAVSDALARASAFVAGDGRGGAPVPSATCLQYIETLTDAVEYCTPGLSTYDRSKCASVVSSATCPEITCLAEGVGYVAGATTNQMCADLDRVVTTLESTEAAARTAAAFPWLSETLAPCVQTICSTTPTPVTAARLRSASRTFAKNVVFGRLNRFERFIVDHAVVIGIVVLVVVLGLFLLLGLRDLRLSSRLRAAEAALAARPTVAVPVIVRPAT